MSFIMPNAISNNSTRDARPIQANFQAISDAFNNDYLDLNASQALVGALTLPGAPTADLHAATKLYVDLLIPPGSIFSYAGASVPAEYTDTFALCQGQLIDKDPNPLLYAALGTTYGAETGTQFRLPDLQSKFVVGKGTDAWSNALAETGGSKDAVAVAHTHSMTDHSHNYSGSSNTGGSSQDIVRRLASGGSGFWTGADDDGDGYMNTVTFGTGGWALIFTGMHVDYTTNHTHSFSWSGTTTGANSGVGNTTASQTPTSTGTDKNLPPYITLNKIIRLG